VTVDIAMFKVGIHAEITVDANTQLHEPLDSSQLDVVVVSNMSVDLDQFNSCLHFDNCAFDCSVQAISDQWVLIDWQADRLDVVALHAFGRLLHTTQDFYAHSNWVELHAGQDPIPVWDQHVSSLPADIVSGTFVLDSPKCCGPGAPSHAELNKDDPESQEGKKLVSSGPNEGRTLFELARAAATNASVVQLQRLVGAASSHEVRSARPVTVATPDKQRIGGFIHALSDRRTLVANRPPP
jgi:hypothetical protein